MDVIPVLRNALEVRIVPGKGRGVFTLAKIPCQQCIEISPVIVFSEDEYAKHGQYTVLNEFTYFWKGKNQALALGLGSLFNHSRNPNVCWIKDEDAQVIRYYTIRDIQSDEELCISYGNHVWFEEVDEHVNSSEPEDDENFLLAIEN
ncbi:histone lysine methyltransferase Set7 [Schizosaccharomyces japonicus yFS275]|uniref:Histone lysine methyltransferase Set7 n=1 Tax=Schizosaccharomyces japonicus (strain yFS275 / FY16936) TaxID=402676 RepID=B6K4D1_SCHJY|nr:histone lysine methyltransferase Set7 [Schizosaccharomyces japonicus yFS275]EEB08338.1 histone lysine methyltransferase Set7 [Schizosaccharomyces japonicus yFS275]